MENKSIASLILMLAILSVYHLVNGFPITEGRLPTAEDRYDFMVSLQERFFSQNSSKFKHICCGTLIESQWLLTAAHCTYSKNISNIVAVIGEKSLRSENIFRYEISKIFENFFNPSSLWNDIAMLKLQIPIRMNYLKFNPIPLYTSVTNPIDPVSCKILGFGATKYGGDPQDNLFIANISVISNEECTNILGRIMAPQMGSNAICAMGNGTDTCQGDSGGPLLCSNGTVDFLFAITSHGITCGANGVPSIYTLIQPYLEWIYKIKQIE